MPHERQKSFQKKPFAARIKRQEKPQIHSFWEKKESFPMIATCMQNLEDELVKELEAIGAEQIKPRKRAVQFQGDLKLMYQANVWLRTALKVLRPITSFHAKNDQELYEQAKAIQWHEIFVAEKTFAIDAAVHSSFFKHSQYAALKVKDAIVDCFQEKLRVRPSVDRRDADIRIHLHISQDRVDISLDSSGDPLFKRGYRQARIAAPMNECLAAGMLMKANWKGERDFLDPMCGSGTIAIEAALMAANIPPNLHRTHFGFEGWKDYNNDVFAEVLQEAKSQFKPIEVEIIARDTNSQAIRATRVNVNAAQLRKHIKIEQVDFFKAEPPYDQGFMMCNPPYGERLQVEDELPDFYQKIGSTLKHEYMNWQAWFISSELPALKQIGLKPKTKIPLMNGKLECQLRGYDLFEGKLEEQK